MLRTIQYPSIVLLILSLLLACHQPGIPAAAPAPLRRLKPAISVSRLERKIHQVVNRERQRQGLSPLRWDDSLARIARQHSSDMGSRRYFSHETSEGRTFSFRYDAAGYVCRVRVGSTIYLGAENIALNHLYDRVTTVNGVATYDWNSEDRIAETTVRGWMNSPGHRQNILTPHWGKEGIGIFITPGDEVYITQNFC
jgi:uncharacterized protein YkwD